MHACTDLPELARAHVESVAFWIVHRQLLDGGSEPRTRASIALIACSLELCVERGLTCRGFLRLHDADARDNVAALARNVPQLHRQREVLGDSNPCERGIAQRCARLERSVAVVT